MTRSSLDIFARVYARAGQEEALAEVLVTHLPEVRATAGCLVIHDYRAVRDPRLLYIHSRWTGPDAFEQYARSTRTERFVSNAEGRMQNPPLQALRTTAIIPAATPDTAGGLYIFAPLHARAGNESAVEEALRAVHVPTTREAGCIAHHAYRGTRDRQLFYVYSVWQHEAAFDNHIGLTHTRKFSAQMDGLLNGPLEVTRATLIG